MLLNRRGRLFFLILLLISSVAFIVFHLMLPNFFLIQQKPEPTKNAYEYYIIIDADTNKQLMYVPLPVHIGDEVVSEENKKYQVFKIEENRAYARFIEYVNLSPFQPPSQ